MDNAAGEAVIAHAVEAYRKALLTADKAQLEALCLEQVSYGHSSGLLQTKPEFIADATSGKTVWRSIGFESPTNRVVGDNAISRFIFVGENQSDGKANALRFGTVIVWHRQDGQWKLLLRQGYKI
jgi:hypothetical protein